MKGGETSGDTHLSSPLAARGIRVLLPGGFDEQVPARLPVAGEVQADAAADGERFAG